MLLPLWITQESWDAFAEMRKTIRAKLTPYASQLILKELCKLKASGENPQTCLDQSTRNGWRDVWPERSLAPRLSVGQQDGTPPWEAQKQAQAVAADKAARAVADATAKELAARANEAPGKPNYNVRELRKTVNGAKYRE